MKTQIKAFYAAHKTAVIIGGIVILVIGGLYNNYTEQQQFNRMYMNRPIQGMQGAPSQVQQPQGIFSRIFGGSPSNQTTQEYSNTGSGSYYGNGAGYNGSYAMNQPMSDNYTSGYDKQQAAYDRINENYDDYIRGQENYSDGNGNTYKLNSGYSNTYVNETTGEYTQSNDANYDPNQYSTSSWTSVSPSSTYSSSSSSSESAE